MKQIKLISLYGLMLFILTVACNNNDHPVNPVTDHNTVYFSTNDYDTTSNGLNILLWKNGVRSSIGYNEDDNRIENMYVNGSDVYIAGYGKPTGSTEDRIVAKYWKNGAEHLLPDFGAQVVYSTDIFVAGNDVYVSGGINASNATKVAVYWKNGVPVVLSDSTHYTLANSIFVSGNDVYVCGAEEIAPFRYVAKYWKNGIPVSLSDTASVKSAYANDIVVKGNDVYITGYEVDHNDQYYNAIYWKNGVRTVLAYGSRFAYGNAIAVNGSDVYIAGSVETSYLIQAAVYWKNGVKVQLTDGTHQARAQSISVVGTDVYVGGYENKILNTTWQAKYWKNSNPVVMSERLTVLNLGGYVFATP